MYWELKLSMLYTCVIPKYQLKVYVVIFFIYVIIFNLIMFMVCNPQVLFIKQPRQDKTTAS